VYCGIDLVEPARVARWHDRYDQETLGQVFTTGELARVRHSADPVHVLSVCLAAKEAVAKALGTGLAHIDWTDVDTVVCEAQAVVSVSGVAAALASRYGIAAWHGSWSTIGSLVAVVVLAEPREERSCSL
jgi:holo-[acyl-carrier protein] synthase